MSNEPLPAQGPVDVNVRPVIEAYKNWTGTSDDRWDAATDTQMGHNAASPGYPDFREGWDAAISMIAAEVERLTWALDHGWDGECIPYGGDGNTRLGVILTPNA